MYQINSLSRTPVYEQIEEQTKRFILTGALKSGEQLPSVRALSIEHTVNPRTILKAYNDLDALGLIVAVPGKGYFVRENAIDVLKKEHLNKLSQLEDVFKQMAMAGVEKSKILDLVNTAYKNQKESKVE